MDIKESIEDFRQFVFYSILFLIVFTFVYQIVYTNDVNEFLAGLTAMIVGFVFTRVR